MTARRVEQDAPAEVSFFLRGYDGDRVAMVSEADERPRYLRSLFGWDRGAKTDSLQQTVSRRDDRL